MDLSRVLRMGPFGIACAGFRILKHVVAQGGGGIATVASAGLLTVVAEAAAGGGGGGGHDRMLVTQLVLSGWSLCRWALACGHTKCNEQRSQAFSSDGLVVRCCLYKTFDQAASLLCC